MVIQVESMREIIPQIKGKAGNEIKTFKNAWILIDMAKHPDSTTMDLLTLGQRLSKQSKNIKNVGYQEVVVGDRPADSNKYWMVYVQGGGCSGFNSF
jgi:hypothetical protein